MFKYLSPLFIPACIFLYSCTTAEKKPDVTYGAVISDSNHAFSVKDSVRPVLTPVPQSQPVAEPLTPAALVDFALSLRGTPYVYASSDPMVGFDCSGFITYVYNHFGIAVPRSSKDFEFFGETIPLTESKLSDLILFTGTDSTVRNIGHIGIIISRDSDSLRFVHSTSGKAHSVTVSALDKYYQKRFVRVLRVPLK